VIGRARSRMIGERKKRRTPAHRRVTKNFDPCDEHELRVDDVDVKLEQGPSFDATELELKETEGFSGFRVPEDRSTVFESCHDTNTTRADVTRFVDSIDGIYGGSVRDSESESSVASLPGSASCPPSSKRRYVKATTVHNRL
jgi:hypothetical protein